MNYVEPLVRPTARPRVGDDAYAALAGRIKLLSWLSLAWMTVEGAVAIAASIQRSAGWGLASRPEAS